MPLDALGASLLFKIRTCGCITDVLPARRQGQVFPCWVYPWDRPSRASLLGWRGAPDLVTRRGQPPPPDVSAGRV